MSDEKDQNCHPEEAEQLASHDLSLGQQKALACVREFPRTPGVYLFKDAAGIVIYVGKATNLRSRAAKISASRPASLSAGAR